MMDALTMDICSQNPMFGTSTFTHCGNLITVTHTFSFTVFRPSLHCDGSGGFDFVYKMAPFDHFLDSNPLDIFPTPSLALVLQSSQCLPCHLLLYLHKLSPLMTSSPRVLKCPLVRTNPLSCLHCGTLYSIPSRTRMRSVVVSWKRWHPRITHAP